MRRMTTAFWPSALGGVARLGWQPGWRATILRWYTEKAVTEIQVKIFTSVLDSIVSFVATSASLAESLIPAAVFLTGVRTNGDIWDHWEDIKNKGAEILRRKGHMPSFKAGRGLGKRKTTATFLSHRVFLCLLRSTGALAIVE